MSFRLGVGAMRALRRQRNGEKDSPFLCPHQSYVDIFILIIVQMELMEPKLLITTAVKFFKPLLSFFQPWLLPGCSLNLKPPQGPKTLHARFLMNINKYYEPQRTQKRKQIICSFAFFSERYKSFLLKPAGANSFSFIFHLITFIFKLRFAVSNCYCCQSIRSRSTQRVTLFLTTVWVVGLDNVVEEPLPHLFT